MSTNYFKQKDERGESFLPYLASTVFGIVAIILAIMALLWAIPYLYNTLAVNPQKVQVALEEQGYELTMNEVRSLISNESEILTKGGQGPNTDLELEEGKGNKEIYLSVEKTGSDNITFLRYTHDDSIVGSPSILPENLKDSW